MNDTFSAKRFGLLVKKYAKENRHSYVLYIATLFGILFFIYGITILSSLHSWFPIYFQSGIFIIGLLFSSSLFSSLYYSFFNNKSKGISFLTVPAATLEKVSLGFLVTQIVFFASFAVIFFILDHMMCGFYNHFHKMPDYVLSPEDISLYTAVPLSLSDETVQGTTIVAVVLSAITHFGSLRFEKNAFVKTALFVMIVAAIIFFYNYYSLIAMIPENSMPGGKFFNLAVRVGNKGIVYLPDGWTTFMYWFLPGILYVLFWLGSYYKLKEKQV